MALADPLPLSLRAPEVGSFCGVEDTLLSVVSAWCCPGDVAAFSGTWFSMRGCNLYVVICKKN